MRSILGFLGVLLSSVSHAFAADSSLDKYCGSNSPPEDCIAYADASLKEHSHFLKANAENHPIIDFCFTTKDPPGCITSFRTNKPDAYALEIAHMEQQLAQEEARYKALLREQAQFKRRYQAERQQEDQLARQREQDHAIFLHTEQARLMAAE